MKELYIVLALLIVSQTAEAQFKNIMLDPQGAYEPSVAVSRDDTQNIVVSSAPNNIYYTNNGGLSWEKTTLTANPDEIESMTLLADFKGNFFCLYQSVQQGKSRIMIRESTNGGASWSEGVAISTDTGKYAVHPRAAVDRKGNLFVTWTEFDRYESDDENCFSRIMLSRSSSGKKWSKAMELSQTFGNCRNDDNTQAGAIPSVMGDGTRAFAIWASQQKIFFDRSFDGTMWLSNDLAITDQAGGWSFRVPGTGKTNGMPTLLCNNTKKTNLSGALYLVWADQLRGENDTDIRFTRSLNFGDSWDQVSRINDDKAGKHQYLPAMALDSQNGNLYIVYYDRRDHTNESTDVYLAYSTNGGGSFKNVKISETPFVSDESVSPGNFIGIAVHEGVITPVWTRTENGSSSVWTAIIRLEDLEKVK